MSILNFLIALIVLYLGWTLTIRLGLKSLSCSRTFSRSAVFEGESGELIEIVRNDKPFIIPWLRVESYISPYLRMGKQDNLHVSNEMYYCSVFTLMPYQQIRRRNRVTFLKRGAYDLGNAALTSGDVLGLFQFLRTQELHAPVLVYPSLLASEDLPMPVSRILGELIRRRQLLQDPFLVRGIRTYQPGDPVRDIHWAATARTGETQVRIHDYSARTRLMVVLNVQPDDFQWGHYISDADSRRIEEGIRLAASVCMYALRAGLSAGFASNMPTGQSRDTTLVLPADGISQEEELLGTFARLNIRCTTKFPLFLESLSAYSDLDILVLSCYDSDSIRASIQKLQHSDNRVTFHLLEGGSL